MCNVNSESLLQAHGTVSGAVGAGAPVVMASFEMPVTAHVASKTHAWFSAILSPGTGPLVPGLEHNMMVESTYIIEGATGVRAKYLDSRGCQSSSYNIIRTRYRP